MCRKVAVPELAAWIPGIVLAQMWVCDLVMSRNNFSFEIRREVNRMYQALYRKYRPQTFDDVVGQQAVTQTLKTQLQSGRLSHAYLFTGSRGTGKTSSAKILAKAVNCENPVDGNPCNCCDACRAIDSGACMDVLEIDAASNNGVDNVRDLRDEAVYTPSQVRKRVYIIDEVHMLSISAFNALLKIIEEPPEHLLFILATTELHKVPATILSRCQRFSFRRISQEDIAARLQYVAYQENIDLDDSAARVLARLADGGMRDALSLLDQCASATAGELTQDRVCQCLGIAGIQQCAELMEAVANRDSKTALTLLDRSYAEGKDMAAALDELVCLLRDLMVIRTAPREGITLLSGVASDKQVTTLAARFTDGELQYMMNTVQTTLAGFSRSASKRLDTELCVLKLCQPEITGDIAGINARLSRLEADVKSGSIVRSVEEPAIVQAPAQEQPPAQEEPVFEEPPVINEAPVGFWTDLAEEIRRELKPPVFGFFAATSSAPVQGVLHGNTLVLQCNNSFTAEVVNKPDILTLVGKKATAKLGFAVEVTVQDMTAAPKRNPNLERLLDFGRAHSDIVSIKE